MLRGTEYVALRSGDSEEKGGCALLRQCLLAQRRVRCWKYTGIAVCVATFQAAASVERGVSADSNTQVFH